MPSAMFWLRAGAVVFAAAVYFPAIAHWAEVVGVFRQPGKTHVDGSQVTLIADTVHCEDIHHHAASDTVFAACEDDPATRRSWFPGLGILDDPVVGMKARGSIHVIDPKTLKSRRLQFEGFDGGFVTHGIDVVSDKPGSVYIFAVNHLPNPDYVAYKLSNVEGKFEADKARSQIEVFHHVLGSSTARHVRTIRHPLIRTPNDVLARTPTSIYVTNDHYYREGHMRTVEDVYSGARWSHTVHVSIDDLSKAEPTSGIEVDVVVTGLHNNNGLGQAEDGFAIGSAASGGLHLVQWNGTVTESIALDSAVDNPSYFRGSDVSGHVLAGLSRASQMAKDVQDPNGRLPVMVWFVYRKQGAGWVKRLIFEDDGSRISSASAAVLIGDSARDALLLVTGFLSDSVLAVKVDAVGE